MKKILSIIFVLLLVITLSSCDKYSSSLETIGLVRIQTSHGFETSFDAIKDGQLVFKKQKTDKGEGAIHYSINVEKGELKLYYDIYGIKEELAHVKAGESIDELGGYVEGGRTVYIIIEVVKDTRCKVIVELDN